MNFQRVQLVAVIPVVALLLFLNGSQLVATAQSFGQTGTSPALSFEVATVKANKSAPLGTGGSGLYSGGSCHGIDTKYSPAQAGSAPPLGRCVFTLVPLETLVVKAYGIDLDRSVGISGKGWWSNSGELFDVQAKAEDPSTATDEQLRLALRTLLAESFKLEIGYDSKEIPGFALLVAKNGAKLQESQGDGPQRTAWKPDFAASHLQLNAVHTPISILCSLLGNSGVFDGPVNDETGLKGVYDLKLEWDPSGPTRYGVGVLDLQGRMVTFPGTGPSGATIVTALQEQLGLRAEPRKIIMKFVVIRSAEKPQY